MRSRSGPSEGLPQYPEYLVPVLVHYDGEDATEDLGNRPYKCPFHGDKTPSSTVNTAEGWFRCHAFSDCPQGNAIQIIMKKEDLSYAESLERAAEIAGKRDGSVRKPSTRSGRMAGGSRSRDGKRSLRRTWGSS